MLDITDTDIEIEEPQVISVVEPIVIIGSGHAGYQLALALRKQSQDVSITVFTADDGAIYSKPALSNALALGKDGDSLVRETALSWEKHLNVRVYPHTKVTQIDRANKKIQTSIGEYPYGRLVLATGATPIVVPIQGDTSAVLSVNDLADYRHFRQQLTGKQHVTVLGDGLIGCEFANDLAVHGIQVSVVGLGQWAMQRLIPQPLGNALQQALSQLGVEWKLQNSIHSILAVNNRYQVTLQGGQQFETDLIVSAVGLRPNIALAQTAGLDTARGILTGLDHCTSDASIFALGDCAEVNGQWTPYIAPINQAIPALTDNLLGKNQTTQLQDSPVIVKTPVLPLSLLPAMSEGEWRIEQQNDEWAAGFYDATGKLTGFALLGRQLQQHRSQWLAKLNTHPATV
ncbi:MULTISPECIES: FAD-dependent oxidoreductase [unclassified Acinetobacter]|uniref:NAD(P)/FAD-dependent oxidoreductase n=1 Tax=unclassified Acinetobacter TaxID=196816 RepID=UPI0024485454|nr:MULTISPECIES: FAD-dependent oxidoreductase [unclassified Acinetobacter]MDH0032252.1 FAD-dependent oxidoreductase [Acinetobacter sp. GD04021]MDH0887538.1 FAD-dependent oxidoreductase [Acinetobacter sp. GD03873]MDH1084204.1 FAD-dependent oxidoreductase [Acinetobacter sp. GD03983]MDH2190848.1 FAD-dependent oxidoreductase [Acinetobacter sp. GD03645]MDH2203881.1 FAD-dependent oxidoreductase [Acinetobacter sp. GD03647]